MPAYPKPFVPKPVKPLQPCTCVAPDAIECLAQRSDAGYNMTRVVSDDGCACRCHRTGNGAQIPPGAWEPLRVTKPAISAFHAVYKVLPVDGGWQIFCNERPYEQHVYPQYHGAQRRCKQLNDALKV